MPHRTPSDFVRAYPSSREWLSLLIRRMDAVASVYRLAALLSPGIDGLRSHVESRDALESRGLRLWCHPSWVFGSSYHSLSCLAFHKTYSVWVAPRPWWCDRRPLVSLSLMAGASGLSSPSRTAARDPRGRRPGDPTIMPNKPPASKSAARPALPSSSGRGAWPC